MTPTLHDTTSDPSQVPALSQELLDRAHAGWERFASSLEEPSDD
ncbi:hypothetical protein [Streptomyces erythrochromogenes]